MPSIGLCENLIRGERDDWIDAEYCNQLVIDLGIPGDRNICQQCHANTMEYRDKLVQSVIDSVASDDEWTALLRANIRDTRRFIARLLANGEPLSTIRKHQRSLRRDLDVYRRVLRIRRERRPVRTHRDQQQIPI
jgi:hypothetical protein